MVDGAPREELVEKKFGTFLGVFTPSILTILGVIMYQRFGWVVGNAGLVGTLLVVLLAHVISLTTGLSVASIATNHTVRTGGNYYIISRSLGLSIGGAIGLALYLALALGVSLYLIGFAEAVLAVTDDLSYFADEKDNIRLVATVACAGLAALTFAGTSIAMGVQLPVMGAIGLSLVSIALGSPIAFGEGETAVALGPPEGAPSFATVFAVFFPAVTGFTAGVGMSGDLRDPKRAIPLGTMAAILTGLVIYLALPVYLGFGNFASVEALQTDNNILLRMAWVPELVTAGVFFATLSSALGSLLGAPRTLQALAMDGVVWRIFSRGRTEPRIALLLTLFIAELGILVGELEKVGAIITMFFLTCYGFLCWACGLERWASPDFRPQFRVPVWVSLLGGVACFLVMFQINALAMAGAIVIMLVLYLVLKRRQLVLGSGDTWGGVWSAVVRLGLMRLRESSSKGHQRNWRPNMIAMGRRSPTGRGVIDFGRMLVGDRGIMTHFDLVKGELPRPRVDAQLESEYPGMFARIQGCEDVFEAIPDVAANFGLAGMESNVVLVGWPQDAGTNLAYASMIAKLRNLDLSVLMLRYEPLRAFGKRERIDIWWDGVAPTGQLMLTLAHLLLNHSSWKSARVRVLVNGRRNQDNEMARKRLVDAITEARIPAEGVVLPPLVEEMNLADRIRQESAFADLLMIHALESTEGGPENFVAFNDKVIASLTGAVLLVYPDSVFAHAPAIFEPREEEEARMVSAAGFYLEASDVPQLSVVVHRLESRLKEALDRFHQAAQISSLGEERALIQGLVAEIKQIRQLERRLEQRGHRREAARSLLNWARGRFGSATMERIRRFVVPVRVKKQETQDGRPLTAWEIRMADASQRLRKDLGEAIRALPASVLVATRPEDWAPCAQDRFSLRLRRFWVRLGMRLFSRKPPSRAVRVRDILGATLGSDLLPALERAIRALGVRRFDALYRARRLTQDVERFFQNLVAELDLKTEEELDPTRLKEVVLGELSGLEAEAASVVERFERASAYSTVGVKEVIQTAAEAGVAKLSELEGHRYERAPAAVRRARRRASDALGELPSLWADQIESLALALVLDIQVVSFAVDVRRGLYQLYQRVRSELIEGPIATMDRAVEVMARIRALEEHEEAAKNDKTPGDEEATENEELDEAPDLGVRGASDAVPGEGQEGGSENSEDTQDLKKTRLAAADELRSTWEEPYRPVPREFIDQLLLALGRAAEKLPDSVQLLGEAAFDAAQQGTPSRAKAMHPTRRLAHGFLEKRIAQPARSILQALPDRVQASQSTLVDAVRLVAFELEQTVLGNEQSEGSDEALALGTTLGERMLRVKSASTGLSEYLTELRTILLHDAVRALELSREAVVGQGPGASLGSAGGTEAVRAKSQVWARKVRQVLGTVEQGVTKIRRLAHLPAPSLRRKARFSDKGALADRVMELRAAYLLNAEVQGALPLIYRRIFGRAALETSALVRGRDEQILALRRMVERWGAGTGGPIGIIGDPRSGKSTLASIVARELLQDRTIVRVAPPQGGAQLSEDLNRAVVRAVGAREGQSAEGALRSMPPGAVILIDDLGRWVERAPGGMAALSLWLRLWRRLGERHLFVLTSTPYTWTYADRLMELGQCFLGTTVCTPVSRNALRDLLLVRQRTSDFDLVFERGEAWSIRGFLFGNESRHFTRLHERSFGNIGDALELWRRSITGVTERKVFLSVRAEPDIGVLNELPLRWYAALVGIAVHRSVTVARMARIMRLPRDEATGLLVDLERAGLLSSDQVGAWCLDTILEPAIVRALRQRGLLL